MNEQYKLTDIERAVQILKRGGVVIFPTETVYGLGCRADNSGTVMRLYRIKNKPLDEPAPVLISRWDELFVLDCKLDQKIENLLKKYWPGALTVILTSESKKVSSPLVKDGKIGVRLTDHSIAKELIRQVGFPLVGTSANFHGKKPPTKFEDIDIEFARLGDLILKGECPFSAPSTVVDCTTSPFKIIREGALKIDPEDLL